VALGARGEREQCEFLFELCRALRNSDPEGMVLAASLAVQIAERLEAASGAHPETADLQARAWAELGNARRVADCLSAAEADLARALDIAGRGTGDPLLLARLMDLTASLYTDQRRLDEAVRLLGCVYGIHRHRGDLHAAGRALISQGMVLGYAFESEQAVEHLGQGLRQIDANREPQIALAATHNLLWCLVDCGRGAEAQALLGHVRDLYAACGERFDELRGRWLEGRIAVSLGDDASAERSFLRVREGFEVAGLLSDIALVSLDLAALWLRQERTAEVRHLVDDLVAVFRSNGIRREALGALLMFKEALHKDRVTESLLRTVTAEIWRLERSSDAIRHPAGP
jgi:tetratricopeptide (TPR) repeat protein